LARLDRGEQPYAGQRLLDMFANAMEPVYGFQSLLQYKDKFHPVYQPLYLTYPDPVAIGAIATAIGRAYLPHLTSRQALRLLTKLRWPHFSRGKVAAKGGVPDARGHGGHRPGDHPRTTPCPVNQPASMSGSGSP
jgi:hypothetical protein